MTYDACLGVNPKALLGADDKTHWNLILHLSGILMSPFLPSNALKPKKPLILDHPDYACARNELTGVSNHLLLFDT